MGKIFFRKEAEEWNQAFPVGNGFLGAMVFGNTVKERIQVNEDSVWSGGFSDRVNPDASKYLKKIREYLFAGNVQEAEKLAEQSMYATCPNMRVYQPLGDIWIRFPDQEVTPRLVRDESGLPYLQECAVEAESYQRILDVEKAVGTIKYCVKEKEWKREFFVSNPAQAGMYSISAESEADINLEISATRKDNRSGRGISCCDQIQAEDNQYIWLEGASGGQDGIAFVMGVRIIACGGRQYQMGSRIIVEQAKKVLICFTGRTTFRSEDPKQWCRKRLEKLSLDTYEERKKEHIEDYRSYFDTCRLVLGQKQSLEHLTTPERLKRIRAGENDIGLINLYYDFARYLLISSSREGSLPANLQGIWNEEFEPMWGSKYTININIQMNYWMAEKTGLSGLHLPLLEHLKRMYPKGKEVAASMYQAEGFCCHHNTDIWGDCAPQDYHTSSTIWPMGGAWLCLHIYAHYQYTKDVEFLKEYFPVLEDSVRFFVDYMIQNPDGKWVTGPSSSPENIYITEENQYGCLCMGPTMDIEIVRELFGDYVKVAAILEQEGAFTEIVKERMENLPELRVGKYGQIQEWDQDYEELEVGHRHISQLFALYPAQQIRKDKTPKLAEAAEKTLDRRLENGGGHTGWSKAWIILFFARLWNGKKAYQNLQELLAEATLDNLLDNHPPFQIDGNFGGACGILEMIVQDFEDTVYLLPALPQEISDGRVNGIRTKSGFLLDMEWTIGRVKRVELKSVHGTEITIVNEVLESRKIQCEKGEKAIVVFE